MQSFHLQSLHLANVRMENCTYLCSAETPNSTESGLMHSEQHAALTVLLLVV